MKNFLTTPIVFVVIYIFAIISQTDACTSMIVTKGASKDGSVMVTYTCDGEYHPILRHALAADHKPGDSLEITDRNDKIIGKVKQVEHTYAYVGLMNEYQLFIGETTTVGREELKNPDGLLAYWDLIRLALQRAKTAREAIKVMTDFVETYGYRSWGESFSIADKKEAWIMEMIGPGKGGKGAIWVAMKVPNGYIAAYANKMRIGKIPKNDPKNCIYSKNIFSFAQEKGYYDPKSKKPFLFNVAYGPDDPKNLRYCSTRVWSIFSRAAPSKKFSPDYHRSVEGAKPYPLWVKPDKKLSLSDVFALMRSHYEGTDFDMTKGITAGPYGTPNRWRPLSWMVDSVEYSWERPLSTMQTGASYVSQSRSHLPDAIGGVLWYGVDDTYFACYTPLYCCIDVIPKSYTVGSLQEFTWESAWWVFNFVSNYAHLKYSYMAPEVVAVRKELEGTFMALQPTIEKTALSLAKTNKKQLVRYLTNYSVTNAEMVVSRWRKLGEDLMVKYNDGYVKDEKGKPLEKGYPEEWLKRVIKDNPEKVHLKKKKEETPKSRLVD